MLRLYAALISLFLCLSLDGQNMIIGQGNSGGIVITTSDNAQNSDGHNTLNSQGFLPNLNAASRFLSQSTFGANYETIESLSSTGIENWIDGQFNETRSFNIIDKIIEYKNIKNTAINDPDDGAHDYYFDFAWWQYHMKSTDVLRQRVALALSEFFVISQFSSFGDNPYALGTYYDMLLDHSFGKYRELLEAVTYHPAMGEYLTYMNNPKSDTIYNLNWDNGWPPDTISIHYVFPDENYAREVMQLFSIGLCVLDIDGTCLQNAQGGDSATYDNVDIAEFAKIFTGFSYGDNERFNRGPGDWEETFTYPMQIYDDHHEPGEKYLLNGFVVDDRNPVDGAADVDDALNNLFNHQNVGPFLGKYLIQRLVTSNPSPAYIRRVAEAFNGTGPYGDERGDMKAVIKAIFLDEEARGCDMGENTSYGMLREPFVRYVQLAKAFDLTSQSGNYRNAMRNVYESVQQKPFTSPSVFNFFQSDYQPIGVIEEAGKVAPEFQITNTQTISGYLNGLNDWLMRDRYTDEWGLYNGEPDYSQDYASFNFMEELMLVEDGYLPQLVERLNLILAHGKLSQPTIDAIINAITEFEIEDVDCHVECLPWCGDDPNCDPNVPDPDCVMYCEDEILRAKINRINLAIYLVMASPEYLINR